MKKMRIVVFILFVLAALAFSPKYLYSFTRTSPDGMYEFHVYRSVFHVFGFPGSSGDAPGYGYFVRVGDGFASPKYYLTMINCAYDIDWSTISIDNSMVWHGIPRSFQHFSWHQKICPSWDRWEKSAVRD